jgi:predicted nucleic acid-binding Zn ribbon protein
MFCNSCGSPVTPEQIICSHCGRHTTGGYIVSAARRRVAEHVHLVAMLWFVLGAFFLIPAVIMGVLAAAVTVPLAAEHADKIAFVFAPGLFVVLCVFFVASAILRFIAGWALLKMQPWGRTFALVVAFLALLSPPFDTALGVYTLFVLLPDAAGDEYRRLSQAGLPAAASREARAAV